MTHDPQASRDRQVLLLCDAHGAVNGQASRRRCHEGEGLLHLAVLLIVFDLEERLLLQHRRAQLWDGAWDLAGATHPVVNADSVETTAQAAARCLVDEWGIVGQPVAQGAFTYFAREGSYAEREHCEIFALRHEGAVSPHPDHAHGWRWQSRAAVERSMRQNPEQWTPWATLAMAHLKGETLPSRAHPLPGADSGAGAQAHD